MAGIKKKWKDENKEKDQKKDRIILNKSDKELELYWGEIKNDKPNGKGVSEKIESNLQSWQLFISLCKIL